MCWSVDQDGFSHLIYRSFFVTAGRETLHLHLKHELANGTCRHLRDDQVPVDRGMMKFAQRCDVEAESECGRGTEPPK